MEIEKNGFQFLPQPPASRLNRAALKKCGLHL